MKPIIFFVLVISLYNNSFAQDISGKWESSLYYKDSNDILVPRFTITIDKDMKKLTGKQVARNLTDEWRTNLLGKVNIASQTMVITDEGFYSNTVSIETLPEEHKRRIAKNKSMHYKWGYRVDSSFEYLTLMAEPNQQYQRLITFTGIVFKRERKTANPVRDVSTVPTTKPHPFVQRANMVFQEIIVDTDSIKVDLYDVAEIDGDSVSVFLNGTLIAEHRLLKAESTTLYLKLDRNLPENRLVIFAENLGKISPNTAYMVITVNNKEYKLYMQSDEKTNGEIVFRFPK
jgi:hypothetical protein